ncbi:MAG TPA: hypothetical protein EYP57_07520 [Thermodesulfobacteriaceae bacterium]|nr:hypothetical protein [Thermodesulfobacteriaceae bacterium]
MKIQSDLNKILLERQSQTINRNDSPDNDHRSFSEILNSTAAASQADPVQRTVPTELSGITGLTESQQAVLNLAEQSLDLLDHYGTMLEDPGLSAKDLEPVAEALASQSEDLRKLRDSLEDHDPLRDTADAIGIISAVEAAKINRGDYE